MHIVYTQSMLTSMPQSVSSAQSEPAMAAAIKYDGTIADNPLAVAALPSTLRRCHRSRLAMTLIEVMIVVALLAIIALMALPTSGSNDSTRLRAAARLLVADIEYARIASLGDSADPCALVLDVDHRGYTLARTGDPDSPMTDPATNLPYAVRFGEGRAQALQGVHIEDFDFGGGNQLPFTPLGTPDTDVEPRIVLRAGNQQIELSIDTGTGEPRVD